MSNVDIFRPRSGVIGAIIAYIFISVLAIQTFYSSGIFEGILTTIWGVFAATIFYLILQRPRVELFDEGIRITNPFEQITVGWQDVESVDAKYTMSIQVGEKSIHAWAAPAPGRHHSRNLHASDIKGMDIGAGGLIRPGENPRTHSGAAAYLATLRLKSFRNSGSSSGCKRVDSFNTAGLVFLITSLIISLILTFYHF